MDSNMDRLIGTLIERTESMGRELHLISAKIDAMTAHHEARVALIEARVHSLEIKLANKDGSSRAAWLIFGAAATIGGLVSTLLGNLVKIWGN